MIIGYCNKTNFSSSSSSINGVIRLVLKFLFFFNYKISQAPKALKNKINILAFFRIRFYIKCGLKLNLVLFIYMYFYLKATVKKIYHDGFNS